MMGNSNLRFSSKSFPKDLGNASIEALRFPSFAKLSYFYSQVKVAVATITLGSIVATFICLFYYICSSLRVV